MPDLIVRSGLIRIASQHDGADNGIAHHIDPLKICALAGWVMLIHFELVLTTRPRNVFGGGVNLRNRKCRPMQRRRMRCLAEMPLSLKSM
jgi:hypothetical protein